jgi:very-short-patch-repair endonuclease
MSMIVTSLTERAKQLRRDATPQEKAIWAELKARKLDGIKFRRQHVFHKLGYIADFYAPERKLVIEIDGKHFHNQGRDEKRDQLFRAWGLTVLRFAANEDPAETVKAIRDFVRRQQSEALGGIIRTLSVRHEMSRTPGWYQERRAQLADQANALKKPSSPVSISRQEEKTA